MTRTQIRIAAQIEDRYVAIRDMDRNLIGVARELGTKRTTLRTTLKLMLEEGRVRMITDSYGFATWLIDRNPAWMDSEE